MRQNNLKLMPKRHPFWPKKCNFPKALHNFSAKNVTVIDYTVKVNKSLTFNFLKQAMLLTTGP